MIFWNLFPSNNKKSYLDILDNQKSVTYEAQVSVSALLNVH